jgi:hypothetical protein
MKMEQTECSETSAYKIQTPGNCREESLQHSEHGKSLKQGTQFLLTDKTKFLVFAIKAARFSFMSFMLVAL